MDLTTPDRLAEEPAWSLCPKVKQHGTPPRLASLEAAKASYAIRVCNPHPQAVAVIVAILRAETLSSSLSSGCKALLERGRLAAAAATGKAGCNWSAPKITTAEIAGHDHS